MLPFDFLSVLFSILFAFFLEFPRRVSLWNSILTVFSMRMLLVTLLTLFSCYSLIRWTSIHSLMTSFSGFLDVLDYLDNISSLSFCLETLFSTFILSLFYRTPSFLACCCVESLLSILSFFTFVYVLLLCCFSIDISCYSICFIFLMISLTTFFLLLYFLNYTRDSWMIRQSGLSFVVLIINRPSPTFPNLFTSATSILTIKRLIASRVGPQDTFFLCMDGKVLSDYDIICTSCSLHVYFRVLGGGRKRYASESEEEFILSSEEEELDGAESDNQKVKTPSRKRRRKEKESDERLIALNESKKKERQSKRQLWEIVCGIVSKNLSAIKDDFDKQYGSGIFNDFCVNVVLCTTVLPFPTRVQSMMINNSTICVCVINRNQNEMFSREFILVRNSRDKDFGSNICDISMRIGGQIVSSFVVHKFKDVSFCESCLVPEKSGEKMKISECDECQCLTRFLLKAMRLKSCTGAKVQKKVFSCFFEKIGELNLVSLFGDVNCYPFFMDSILSGYVSKKDDSFVTVQCEYCEKETKDELECCLKCENLRRRCKKQSSSISVSPDLEKLIINGSQYIEKMDELRKHYCLDDELLLLLSDCIRGGKMEGSPFLKDFLRVQFEILKESNPNGIRWFSSPERENVFQFFSQIFFYTQQRGYSCVVGQPQWRKNEDGKTYFCGNLVGPSDGAMKKVRKLFSFDSGLQKQPILLLFKQCLNLKLKNVVASLSGDEIHIRKGLIRSSKNGKVIWKGMLIFDENNTITDLLEEEMEKNAENEEENDDLEGECDDDDERTFNKKEKREKIEAFRNKITKISDKYDGSLISRVLQFCCRFCYKQDGHIINFRMPIFYFPTAGLDSNVAYTTIMGTIQFIHNLADEYGESFGLESFQIKSVCFDGDKGVMKFIQEYGVPNKDMIECKYSFLCGEQEITFLPEFGHLLKCIRRDLLDERKRMLFPVVNERNEIEMCEVCSEHLWLLYEEECAREGPSFSGITISHLTATGVLSMKQNLATDFFKKRVLTSISILMKKKKNIDLRGTYGFLEFFHKMICIFKTKWPLRKGDFRMDLANILMHNLNVWRTCCKFSVSDLKSRGESATMKTTFLLKDNFVKIYILLKGFKELSASKEKCSEVMIPYEDTSTDDVENSFNIHRHYTGGGLNNSPSFHDYQRNVGKVFMMKLNIAMLKKGSYESCDFKNWKCITGDNVSFLRKLQKEYEERMNALIKKRNIEEKIDFNFEWISFDGISMTSRGWDCHEEDEIQQVLHFLGAVLLSVRKEIEKENNANANLILEMLISLPKKGGRKETLPSSGKNDSFWKMYKMMLRNFYFNAKKVEYINHVEKSEGAMVNFLLENLSAHFYWVIMKENNDQSIPIESTDQVLQHLLQKTVKFCQRRFLSIKELTGKKNLRSFRQDIAKYTEK